MRNSVTADHRETDSTTDRVRDHYSHYPFPAFDADADDLPETMYGRLSFDRLILWPWRRNLDGLRVLDAGCGTGPITVRMAVENPEIEITAIDLSEPSLDIARRLAERFGVQDQIRFMHLPIAQVERVGQEFDYILSVGVLHHLSDPLAGLQALAGVLAPDGGMALMLYGEYGLAWVKHLQKLLSDICGDRPIAEQISIAQAILRNLPESHPSEPAQWLPASLPGNESNLVDLLLHPQNRSYSVEQVFDLVSEAGLSFIQFEYLAAYEPDTYVGSADLQDIWRALPDERRAVAAELLHGRLMQHLFFAGTSGNELARQNHNAIGLDERYPVKSPRFEWDAAVLGTTGDQQVREVKDYRLGRSFALEESQFQFVNSCDGSRSVAELARLVSTQEGTGTFPAYLMALADNELLYLPSSRLGASES